jgi:hypothetical protein
MIHDWHRRIHNLRRQCQDFFPTGDREFAYKLAFKLFNYTRSVLFRKILNAFFIGDEEHNF